MSKPSAELIKGVPLFADLDEKTVERLSAEFIERHFPEGAAIATEGLDGLNFFVVESGEATVTVHGDVVGKLGPGSIVRRGRTRGQVGTVGDGDGARRRWWRSRSPSGASGRSSSSGPSWPGSCSRSSPNDSAQLSPAERFRAVEHGGHAVRRGARRSCRAGDAAAWNALVERFSRYVLAIATQAFRLPPHDAEEVFQDRVPARLRAARLAALGRCDPTVDRAAHAQLLPRSPARVRPARAGRGGRRDRSAAPDDVMSRLDEAIVVREGARTSAPSARRSSTASSPATRATGRSATRSRFRRGRSRAGSRAASAISAPSWKRRSRRRKKPPRSPSCTQVIG